MLVCKVVKTNFLTILLGLVISMFFGLGNAHAKRTIGDILKNIEKKSEKIRVEKKKSELPSFKKRKIEKSQLSAVKPPSTNSLYYAKGTDEAGLEQVTDEQIKQLYSLVKRLRRSSKRGELWLRLAELYVEKARLIEFRIHNEYDQKMQDYSQKKLRKKPRLNLEPSYVYNRKAIKLYELFVKDFPKNKKVDQALFFLGYNYMELGQESKGEKYYVRLAKEFPKSPYVDESSFALGEYYFEREMWSDAVVYYGKVAKKRKSRLYSFANYKLAWCQYKVGRAKAAMRSLERVVYAGRKAVGKTGGKVSRIRLASEAVKDLIVFYSEVGTYKNAKPYFKKVVGSKSLNKIMLRLGMFYSDSGNYQAASFIFRDLIRQNPSGSRNFELQYQIVRMLQASGNNKLFRKELYNWIDKYGPESSWQRLNKKKAVSSKANEIIESTLRNYVLQQHQTAQNSRAEYSRKQAQIGYSLYFQTFKQSVNLAEMHFFYGELLFDLKDYEKAAIHYAWVAKNAPKSKYYKTSLLNSILAYEKKLPTAKEIKAIIGNTSKPVSFDRAIKSFIEVAEKYIAVEPKGENIVAIKYRIASLYYNYNQFEKALEKFDIVVKDHPDSKEAQYSAHLILDIYNLRKDYNGLEAAAASLLAIPQIAKSTLGTQIKGIKQRTEFKKAQQSQSDKDYLKSARAFEDFAVKNKSGELSLKAKFNAAVNYDKGNELLKAIPFYLSLANSRSKSVADLSKKSKKFLAQIYQRTGQYKKAAQEFERYARKYPRDPVADEFLYNAAVIRDGLNNYNTAIKNYKEYFTKTRSKTKYSIYYLVGKIWERRTTRRNYRKAITNYEKFINSPGVDLNQVVESAYRISQLYSKLRDKKNSEKWTKKVVSIHKAFEKKLKKKYGTSYAAESKLKLIKPVYWKLAKIKIPRSQKAQAQAMRKKLGIIEDLKKLLKQVVAYDDGAGIVGALTLQGQAMHHMATSIYNAPKPKGLDKEQMQAYVKGIDNLAKPFLEQAAESYRAAIKRGFELEGYSSSLKVAHRELHKIEKPGVPYWEAKVELTKINDYLSE